ncbi:hypothetical protein ACVINW_001310 [Bradyrhizobium sp. USDA 4461]
MDLEQQFPGIGNYLDKSDDYENSASEFKHGDDRYLLVTQKGEDGQQLLFKWNGQKYEFVQNDTIIDSQAPLGGQAAPSIAAGTTCGPSSAADHQTVFAYVKGQVDKFSSSSGPDHGNLACCWTVRQLAHDALGRWITRTDGTEQFGEELKACFRAESSEDQVLPGGIIISPTKEVAGHGRNIGHVGFLGEGGGDGRLIYSNSSALEKLEQNFTVGSWKARYKVRKQLDVLFYPLPVRSAAATS